MYLHKSNFSERHDGISYTNLKDIEHYFLEELDADGDGYLDVEELTKWVQPDGFQGVNHLCLKALNIFIST